MQIYRPIIKKNKQFILENVKQAKQYVESEKLSQDELNKLIEVDPTPTRKFVGWMAKQWVNKTVTDIDDLRNTIEEYNVFLEKGKAKTKDIYQFKSFRDLQSEVDQINKSGDNVSVRDLESDFDVIIDNSDLYIASPHLISKLQKAFPKRWKNMIVTALAVLENGKMDGYDGLDKQISAKDIKTFTDITGIS